MIRLDVAYHDPVGDTIAHGTVVAWGLVDPDGNPTEALVPGGRYVVKGWADPIQAARLIEEAITSDGFVWLCKADNGPRLHGMKLIYGRDIHYGNVHDTREA